MLPAYLLLHANVRDECDGDRASDEWARDRERRLLFTTGAKMLSRIARAPLRVCARRRSTQNLQKYLQRSLRRLSS